jgi:RNA-directed DNA polymerase
MTLDQAHINHLKNAFQKMESKEDFLGLLNYSKNLIYGDKAKPFELRHLNYHINTKSNARYRYRRFSIPKKSGEKRIIYAPNKGLKSIQKCLNLIFQVIYNPSHAAMGFVPGKSIVDNAKVHAGSVYVYNIDLKDFFPSIDQARWWGRLQHAPFNLKKGTERGEIANIIAVLCCHNMKVERKDENGEWQIEKRWVLPQGAPTSPTITNIICQQLDFYLLAVAKRFGLKYTRYADDITFSSMHNVYQKDSDFLKELHRIIEEQNFHIKESKTRLQKQGYRQEVTGLLVNEKPNVQKRYIKQLRMWLYYWERYGYDKASVYFILQYMENKGEALSGIPRIENVISGKLDYLKMVKGKENSTYLSLKKRFEELLSAEVQLRNQQSTKSSPQINENLASALRGMGLDPTKMITDPNVIADLTEEAYLMFDFQLPEVNENNRGDHLNEVLNTLLSEGLTKAMQQYKTQD